jgi:hypothetical protein
MNRPVGAMEVRACRSPRHPCRLPLPLRGASPPGSLALGCPLMPRTTRRALIVVTAMLVLGLAGAFFALRVQSPADPASAPTSTPANRSPSASAGTTAGPTVAPTVPATTLPAPGPGSPSSSAPASSATKANLTVTFSGYDAASSSAQAGGYVDVLESKGTCTLTLSSGSATASATQSASPDASTTSCGAVTIPRSALSSGVWKGVLAYASATTVATSLPIVIEVP